MPAILRFAPSPNGYLHLGHAFSALQNEAFAQRLGGEFWLRIEDIDPARSRLEFEEAIRQDLTWLGIAFAGEQQRQSDRMEAYRAALIALARKELLYHAGLSRGDVRRLVAESEAEGRPWPRDADGAPLYPDTDRHPIKPDEIATGRIGGPLRLDMARALSLVGPLHWFSFDPRNSKTARHKADPALWGDVMLARADVATSYHLAVVVDDAALGVSHVVRGKDLEAATAIHVLLQKLLGLTTPLYHHHRLILGADGNKLSKSAKSTSIRDLRRQGLTAQAIREQLAQ